MSKLTYTVIGTNGPISRHNKPACAVAKFWKSDAVRIIVTGFGGLYKGRLIHHGPDTIDATFQPRGQEDGL